MFTSFKNHRDIRSIQSGCNQVTLYLAKAAFPQHHQEVKIGQFHPVPVAIVVKFGDGVGCLFFWSFGTLVDLGSLEEEINRIQDEGWEHAVGRYMGSADAVVPTVRNLSSATHNCIALQMYRLEAILVPSHYPSNHVLLWEVHVSLATLEFIDFFPCLSAPPISIYLSPRGPTLVPSLPRFTVTNMKLLIQASQPLAKMLQLAFVERVTAPSPKPLSLCKRASPSQLLSRHSCW